MSSQQPRPRADDEGEFGVVLISPHDSLILDEFESAFRRLPESRQAYACALLGEPERGRRAAICREIADRLESPALRASRHRFVDESLAPAPEPTTVHDQKVRARERMRAEDARAMFEDCNRRPYDPTDDDSWQTYNPSRGV